MEPIAHDHPHPPGPHSDRSTATRALAIAFALATGFLIVEIVGGILTDSLALIADAAHMLSDSLALGLALGAVWLAGRPATMERTFGYRRAEILAALANGMILVVVAIWILIEAIGRLSDPPEVVGGWMLAVAIAGFGANLVAAWVLHRDGGDSLNTAAALRHVLGDLAGSAGVIVAAVIILTTGWEYADPIVSIAIAVLIAVSSWTILRDSTQILLEGAPRGTDVYELGSALAEFDGVVEVHDLHVWTITSGFPALAAHVTVDEEADCHVKRLELATMLRDRYGIEHSTLQMDHTQGPLLEVDVGSTTRGG